MRFEIRLKDDVVLSTSNRSYALSSLRLLKEKIPYNEFRLIRKKTTIDIAIKFFKFILFLDED